MECFFFVQLYSIPVQSAFENNFFGQNNKLYPLRIKVCETVAGKVIMHCFLENTWKEAYTSQHCGLVLIGKPL